ncbi:hypothetical protein DVA67_017015 [Solirubrobacter sp. CPCC 204708]|uniref:Plastocyanin/azurin family copper-binding protein n=1 Tax=Solirubrobacter deserti TaxID=2282478 RepID=A0ABT4RJX4_9ACTN|nr:plastocyanin/azurin family copper-binding protein [Solirubrobacter deserti]MBE2317685.1 hypothetical protein [Solirubrobacter deserti]MDA0138636.1 plastocyanin/azurin family copper-binding protein [Solirubrobacter deserti]
MRAPLSAVALAATALAFPAVAVAEVKVQAVDGTNVWSQTEVRIKVGETVTWSFAGTATPHNVQGKTPAAWDTFKSEVAVAGPDRSFTFQQPGTYRYICFLHESTMFGDVFVSDETGAPPPPPPPPPLSEQPFANDTPPLTSVEVRDTVVPTLDRVKATRVDRGVRVRFRLSEAGKVTVKLTRGKRVVRTRTVEVAKGTGSLSLRGLKAGSYRVQVSAKDLAGNAAKAASRARVTVRR